MIPYATDDTIAAIASAPAGAVRGIVRISGPQTVPILQRCFQSASGRPVDRIRAPQRLDGVLLAGEPLNAVPGALLLWPGRRSYTRQPAAELHTFGAQPVLQQIVATLCAHGARPAEPGEFTLRAFLAGRIDLTQAEAVLGVIEARGASQLDVALRQLAGGLARPLQQLRGQLLQLLADIEAGLDFAEEEIELLDPQQLRARLRRLRGMVDALLGQMTARQRHDSVYRVVLRGAPNAGKSSLLNALAGDDVAIVSPQLGTTRDFVTRQVRWQDVAVELVDTAGVDAGPPADAIDDAARRLAAQQLARADVELRCVDASAGSWRDEVAALERRPAEAALRIVVLTKTDACRQTEPEPGTWRTSSVTGSGIERLKAEICRCLARPEETPAAAVPATAARCHRCLTLSGRALRRAERLAAASQGDELIAAELREALEQVGRLAGAVFTEDLLDEIFGRFCIGK